MTNLLEVLLLFIIIGVSISIADRVLHRDWNKLVKSAKYIVRDRLSKRDNKSLSVILDECSANGVDVSKVKYLLCELSKLIGISPSENKFTLEDVLGDLLRVKQIELQEFDNEWRKRGLNAYVDVFSDNLIFFLEKKVKKNQVKDLQKKLNTENADVDKVIDIISNMTIKEFLITFAPYM